MLYTDEKLEELRKKVSLRVSAKRFSHILGVERCAKRLGELILPQCVSELRAAAILHDVTKEMQLDEQIQLLNKSDFLITEEDLITVGVIHSFSAPLIVKSDFSEFASENILSAVKNHTVGCENMSVFDKIVFISDYIEDTRTYKSCIQVREMLFNGLENLTEHERLIRLDDACNASIDGAIEALTRDNKLINSRMYKTKNSLLKNKLHS